MHHGQTVFLQFLCFYFILICFAAFIIRHFVIQLRLCQLESFSLNEYCIVLLYYMLKHTHSHTKNVVQSIVPPVLPLHFRPTRQNISECRNHIIKRFSSSIISDKTRHSPATRATGNSRFEGYKFPVLFSKTPENSRFQLITYLHANALIIARKWPKVTQFTNFTKLD